MKGKVAAVAPLAGGLAALRVYDALRKPKSLSLHYLDAPTKVLIVGGGFGGITAVERLVHAIDGNRKVGVALLDRVNLSLFYPMVPKVVSSNLEIGHLAHSIRSIVTLLGWISVRRRCGAALGVLARDGPLLPTAPRRRCVTLLNSARAKPSRRLHPRIQFDPGGAERESNMEPQVERSKSFV